MAYGTETDADFKDAVTDGIYASVSDDGCWPRTRQASGDSTYAAGFALGRALRQGARFHCEFTESIHRMSIALLSDGR